MTNGAALHRPVLVDEVLAALAPRAVGRYLDGTVGLGGHAEAILRASSPDGLVIGMDKDPEALDSARVRLRAYTGRVVLLHRGYEEALPALRERGLLPVDGFLLDLGVSSLQLDHGERGFSFRLNGPIDMRFDPTSDESHAGDLVNHAAEDELADLIWRLGEEPASRRIARAIVRARPLHTTGELATVIERAAPNPRGRISPATRTFQALRMAVNREPDNLRSAIESAGALLAPGGRLVVISFHSLEDRMVKQFMQRESRDCICPPGLPECRCGHRRTFALLGRSSVTPSAQEQAENPRSRSARLRTAVRL
jgi:16S rRNA (cytosine1402-N4)-methyltransferase